MSPEPKAPDTSEIIASTRRVSGPSCPASASGRAKLAAPFASRSSPFGSGGVSAEPGPSCDAIPYGSVMNSSRPGGRNVVRDRITESSTGTPCIGAPSRYLPLAVKRTDSLRSALARSLAAFTSNSTVLNSLIVNDARACQPGSAQWRVRRAGSEDDRTRGEPRRARSDVRPSRAVFGIGTSLENEPNASSVATFAKTMRSSSSMTSSVAARPTRLTRPRGVGARKMPFTNAVSPGL